LRHHAQAGPDEGVPGRAAVVGRGQQAGRRQALPGCEGQVGRAQRALSRRFFASGDHVSTFLKIDGAVAIASFAGLIVFSAAGSRGQARGWLPGTAGVRLVALAVMLALFLLFGFSMIPLMVHAVIGFQAGVHGGTPLVRSLERLEPWIIGGTWALILAGC